MTWMTKSDNPNRAGRHCGMLFLLLLLISANAWALSSDKDQPIEVEADGVEINDSTGVSTYVGNVIISQGSMRLDADRVTIFQKNKRTDKVVATGRPVKFEQKPDGKRGVIKGHANRVEYYATSEMVELIGNAKLTQKGDTFASDRIRYNRKQELVQAGSRAEGSQRVKIKIQADSVN